MRSNSATHFTRVIIPSNFRQRCSPPKSAAGLYRRIGIVFCTQLKRHFTRRRLEAEALGLEGFEPPTGPLEKGLR